MNISANAEKFNSLRSAYPCFTYEQYSVSIDKQNIYLSFRFNLSDKYFFEPQITIPRKPFMIADNLSVESLQNIAFHIGMIELISYWKLACSPEIIIKPHHLNQHQIDWWKKLYFNGLGEFFYLNSITTTIDDFAKITIASENKIQKQKFSTDNTAIIPVGGGKDSVVTLELLSNKNNLALIVNPRDASLQTALAAGFDKDKIIEINRSIHPELLRLNNEGFLNGHTPFSALLAFVCMLSAILTGKKNIALSNESSANESTVANTDVNHQYSKSFQFEKDFREYTAKYISDDINYFSFLRPLSELQIASLFAKYPKYFNIFKSCNAGSKTDIWCGNCPKCLFAYIILSPFISSEKMKNIFGYDLFDNDKLLFYFKQLMGAETVKPFECVGTIDEVNAALCMTIEKMDTHHLPSLLSFYKTTPNFERYKNIDKSALLSGFNNEHFLKPEFESILKSALND